LCHIYLLYYNAIAIAIAKPFVAKLLTSVDSTLFHAEPSQYLSTFVVVLKYKAPSIKASPSLSSVGSEAFGPKYLSSKESYAASAFEALVAALVADDAAAVAELEALVSDVLAFDAEVEAALAELAAAVALDAALVSEVAALLADVLAAEA
jgi:hypothetical protein